MDSDSVERYTLCTRKSYITSVSDLEYNSFQYVTLYDLNSSLHYGTHAHSVIQYSVASHWINTGCLYKNLENVVFFF